MFHFHVKFLISIEFIFLYPFLVHLSHGKKDGIYGVITFLLLQVLLKVYVILFWESIDCYPDIGETVFACSLLDFWFDLPTRFMISSFHCPGIALPIEIVSTTYYPTAKRWPKCCAWRGVFSDRRVRRRYKKTNFSLMGTVAFFPLFPKDGNQWQNWSW